MKKTGVILAGGKSSRMGKNKAFLKRNETPFIEIAIQAFKNFEEIIIISNDEGPYLKYNFRIYEDIVKDLGPMGGIYTALTYSKYDVVVVACDMPYITCEVVETISKKMNDKSIISITNGKIQPLCSGYKKNILKKVKNCIDNNNLKMLNLIDLIDKEFIEFKNQEQLFQNINTINDYNELIE